MGMPVITPSPTTRRQSITDIIASVALEQAALSHILNAEGEKLQRVINTPNLSVQQLLAVNKSVQKTVASVTQLEMVLQSKLAMFGDCLCPAVSVACSEESLEA